jgi:hypothetical protein
MGKACSTHGGEECFGGKARRKQIGRRGHRWEGNIKMDLREIGWGDMDWINLA